VSEEARRIYIGRGLRGETLEEATDDADEQIELSVDLPALQVELEQAMLNFDLLPRHVWLPLTSSVAGDPVLVWDGTDGLVPTLVPVPHLAAEDKTVKTDEGVEL
jgi:hypothetical protein